MFGKENRAKTSFSLTTFDTTAKTFIDNIDILKVPLFTKQQMSDMCRPRAMTRLVDTMVECLHSVNIKVADIIAKMHPKVQALRPKIVAILLSITDGQDNKSYKWTASDLKVLVETSKKKGIDIMFIGANQDAIATAATYGIGGGQAMTMGATPENAAAAWTSATQAIYMAAAAAPPQRCSRRSVPTFTAAHRSASGPQSMPVSPVWTSARAGGGGAATPTALLPLPRGGTGHFLPVHGGGTNIIPPQNLFMPPTRPIRYRMNTVQAYK